jgi:hypothetical protein
MRCRRQSAIRPLLTPWLPIALAYTRRCRFHRRITPWDTGRACVRSPPSYSLSRYTGPKVVEACFHQALAVARRQHAKALELRATISLARLWQQQDRTSTTKPASSWPRSMAGALRALILRPASGQGTARNASISYGADSGEAPCGVARDVDSEQMRRIFPRIACGSLREVTAAPASMSAPSFDPTHDSVLQACQMLPWRADSNHLPGASPPPGPTRIAPCGMLRVWAAFFESHWGQVFLFVAISGQVEQEAQRSGMS